ncbi:MAG: hypothetical protein ACRDHJ_03785 [Actinomycetota bacterium]
MDLDQLDPNEIEDDELDEAGDSSPPESGDAGASAPGSEEEAIAQNARLRAALRAERADRLVERYSLPKPYVSLLRDVPRDKQEQAARAYAQELSEKYPDTVPDPDLDSPAPARTSSPSDEEPQPDELGEQIRSTTGWSDLASLQNRQPRHWERDREADSSVAMPEEAKTAASWNEFVASIDKARAEARGRS